MYGWKTCKPNNKYQKAKKCLVTTYIGVELENKRSRLRSFVSIIVLRFAFRVCIFFCVLLSYLSWATLSRTF